MTDKKNKKALKLLGKLAIPMTALAWLLFFQSCYSYHFFYQEQNQLFLWSTDYLESYFQQTGGLARLTGDFLTQFYYYRYAGPAILAVCLLVIGLLVDKTLRNLHLNRIATLTAVVLMSFIAVCHFCNSYRLSATIAILGWALLLWVVTLFRRRWVPLAVALPVAWLFFDIPQIKKIGMPEFALESNFAVDSEYYFGNYNRVVEMVEKADSHTDGMLFFYNLVQAQRGELPDHLLKYIPNQLGTFYKIGPETPLYVIRNMNDLYWVLGDMTFTERAAMMANVFSRENRDVRMIRRLAETNIVSGDSVAAEKYLRLLDKTLVHDKWADYVRKNGKRIYAEKQQLLNHNDTITTSDNAHFLMMQLLDAHPDNIVALDYILCSTLLLKDMTNFKRDYDRYCMDTHRPRIKKLYQEALCIWLAATEAGQDDWQRYIADQNVLRRFTEYNRQRGSNQFSDTYWYYFDKAKTPQI